MVGTDGSDGAHHALEWVVAHASPADSIEVIHTWHLPAALAETPAIEPAPFAESAEALLQGELDFVRINGGDLGVVTGRTIMGHCGAGLIDAAADADLIVVGTRGHGGFVGLLLGSTSTYLAHHAPCPLVIVPPDNKRESQQ